MALPALACGLDEHSGCRIIAARVGLVLELIVDDQLIRDAPQAQRIGGVRQVDGSISCHCKREAARRCRGQSGNERCLHAPAPIRPSDVVRVTTAPFASVARLRLWAPPAGFASPIRRPRKSYEK